MKPNLWVVILSLMLGVLVGVGGYTFYYAKGASDLSNDPAACVNCHIMREQWTSPGQGAADRLRC